MEAPQAKVQRIFLEYNEAQMNWGAASRIHGIFIKYNTNTICALSPIFRILANTIQQQFKQYSTLVQTLMICFASWSCRMRVYSMFCSSKKYSWICPIYLKCCVPCDPASIDFSSWKNVFLEIAYILLAVLPCDPAADAFFYPAKQACLEISYTSSPLLPFDPAAGAVLFSDKDMFLEISYILCAISP